MSWKGGIFCGTIISILATATAAITQVATSPGSAAPTAQQGSAPTAQDLTAGQNLVNANDCTACHSEKQKIVGPAYEDVAKRYKGQPGAVDKLVAKVKQGGSGNWGTIAMTPHPNLADAQLKQMVEWILSLDNQTAPSGSTANPATQAAPNAAAGSGPAASGTPAKLYTYSLADGTTVKLDFPLFLEGQQQKVTNEVFRGYETFDSYCFRCHGEDATGSEIAPDLRASLKGGMTEEQFYSTVMAGRQDKGMPSWAGFLSKDDTTDVYEYVKGRSLDLVPVGRPSSSTD